MADRNLALPWGKEQVDVPLPAGWRLTGTLEPASLPDVADPPAEVRRSLGQPIGSPPLARLARAGMKVTVVIDDGSRPTPAWLIVPAVIDELVRAGVAAPDIRLVTALGLHRPMDEDELARRSGLPLPSPAGLQWENHEPDRADVLASLGTTSRGTPVLINRSVAQADLVVSVGCIEPHLIASFGGGYKNLVPGVAGRPTIAHNHSLNCSAATFNMVGQPIEGNPMRLDLEEAGGMLKQPVFIANAVLDSHQRIVQVVSGDPIAAHRAGVQTSARLYGVPVPEQADVVVTDSHPMDQDLRQGVKALGNTIRAVRRGGIHITLVRAEEGVGVFGLANRRLPLGRSALRILAPLLVRLVPRLKLQGMGEEDRFFLYFALQVMQYATCLLYGPTIPAAVRANLPFVEFVDSPAAAIARARQKLPGPANVIVFPYGGITYPIL